MTTRRDDARKFFYVSVSISMMFIAACVIAGFVLTRDRPKPIEFVPPVIWREHDDHRRLIDV